MVGDNGIILRTTNGGTTWVPQNSGTTFRLLSVSFTGPNLGTVTGENGTILRTINGGSTWTAQSAGISADLRSVSFSGINNGMIVGDRWTGSAISCVILNTTDGGASWTIQADGLTDNLYGVSMQDENNATAIGYGSAILHTNTGGVVSVEGNQVSTGSQNIRLYKNYPDPFSQQTIISFQTSETGPVRLDIFNSTGIRIMTLVNQLVAAGKQEIVFDASGLYSGIYFYQLQQKGWTETKKMILIR
ncbi:MAG: T9SS type A sorting domain-containing protein [Bacteroidales bacterium]|nr:T9SS type A sorting domain-containing protein [Bacteroidales bacterium]